MVVGECATLVWRTAPPTMFDLAGGEPADPVVGWA
jgi:hypothetical protein